MSRIPVKLAQQQEALRSRKLYRQAREIRIARQLELRQEYINSRRDNFDRALVIFLIFGIGIALFYS